LNCNSKLETSPPNPPLHICGEEDKGGEEIKFLLPFGEKVRMRGNPLIL